MVKNNSVNNSIVPRRKRFYYSRVPVEMFIKYMQEAGAEIDDFMRGGGIVYLPTGGTVYYGREKRDGGVYYSLRLDTLKEEDIKFLQRFFARLNLIMKNTLQACEEVGENREEEVSKLSNIAGGSGSGGASGDELGSEQDKSSSNVSKDSNVGSMSEDTCADSSDSSSFFQSCSFEKEGERSGVGCLESMMSEVGANSQDEACLESSEYSVSRDGRGSEGSPSVEGMPENCNNSATSSCSEVPLQAMNSMFGATHGEGFIPDDEENIEEQDASLSFRNVEFNNKEEFETGREDVPSFSFKDLTRIMKKAKKMLVLPALKHRWGFGGIFAYMDSQGIPPKEFINRAKRVFARLVSDFGEGSEGHRWDYRKVSTRIATYQNWKIADRKKEAGRPVIAVLPDISGSMAWFAEQVIELSKVLMTLGVPGADVMVVVTTDGQPLELWVNGKKLETFDYYRFSNPDQIFDWYEEVFYKYNVRVVVVAADWHGAWLYARMAENMNVRIYWLDVYSSSGGNPILAVKFPPEWGDPDIRWSNIALRKVTYVYNCNDVLDFVKGLELAIRKDKR